MSNTRPTYDIPEPPVFNPDIPKLLNEDRVQASGVLGDIFGQLAENDAAIHEALDGITPASIGAAPAAHAHSPSAVGAAPASHAYNANDIDAGRLAQDRMPTSATANRILRTHPQKRLNRVAICETINIFSADSTVIS